jgi:carboxyl-terminal processing protease
VKKGLPAIIIALIFLFGFAIEKDIDRFSRSFSEALAVIEDNYMSPVDSEKVVYGAIRGMIRDLDPHSAFLDKKTFSQLRESQGGAYYGIGITFGLNNNGELTVIAPIEGSPGAALGIQPGDVIVAIDGESTSGMDLNQAAIKLRGPKGSKVRISVRRNGIPELLNFTIIRAEISLRSVPISLMLDGKTGYIRIVQFIDTTDDEFEKAWKKLEKEGMKQLLIDLRGNPGGLLDQAVAVADCFTREGVIVSTKGRAPGSFQTYHASPAKTKADIPLIILIDRGSASGAEVVAGAVQDHDRGLIVGEKSFGKGLVQGIYPLSEETALALTTAKYFTPSGRCIQRDYSDREEYFEQKKEAEEKPGSAFKTDLGRLVYGGGGIIPDHELKAVSFSPLTQRLLARNLLFEFATRYIGRHRGEIKRDFTVDRNIIDEFRLFLDAVKVEYSPSEFEKAIPELSPLIKEEISRHIFGFDQAVRVALSSDVQLNKALSLFPEANKLLVRYLELKKNKEKEGEKKPR